MSHQDFPRDRDDSHNPSPASVPQHKAPDDNEVVYYEGSPQLRGELGALFGWGLVGLVLIVGGILLWTLVPASPWWLNLLLIIAGLAILLVPVLITKSMRYRISNYRIDYERGIFSKKIDTLELWHVDDINFRQSLIDRMLGVGTITVFSDDQTTPNLAVTGIPNPRPLFDQLKQRVIAVKRQRGVIKMDIGQ